MILFFLWVTTDADPSTSQWVGGRYQMLKVTYWWVELGHSTIFGGNCNLGFHACYHQSIKGFDNDAIRCPLSE